MFRQNVLQEEQQESVADAKLGFVSVTTVKRLT
jgi:hypothetical protein